LLHDKHFVDSTKETEYLTTFSSFLEQKQDTEQTNLIYASKL